MSEFEEKFFQEPRIVKADYVASAVNKGQYPQEDLYEVALIGRSNVGKSSLINSFCQRHKLALVSSTPGKTKTINFFTVTAKLSESTRKQFFLVDLPGYGYAKQARTKKKQWAQFIDEYLLTSSRLKMVFQLIDLRHPPMQSDIDSYNWFVENHIPVMVIATKADKLKRSEIQKNIAVIAKTLNLPQDSIIPYSSYNHTGRLKLLDAIISILLQ